jgi:hypothetical protein
MGYSGKRNPDNTMKPSNICFIERCPRCLKTGDFIFSTSRSGLFGRKYVSRLTCGSCRSVFQNEDIEEGEKLLRIAGIFHGISMSEFPMEEGMQRIDEENSKVLEEIRVGAETWICDTCGEENFSSVGECWKCQNEHPQLKGLEPEEPADPGEPDREPIS